MDFIKGAKYICSCCGKEVFVEQVLTPVKGKRNQFYEDYPEPEGWVINKFARYTCNECSNKK